MYSQGERMPAGKYWIGDLCYVLSADWDAVCELTIKDHEVLDGKFPWKGKHFWMHGTAHGDGCFIGSNGFEYGVDAGLLGIVPVDLVSEDANLDSGTIVEFPESFYVEYHNGEFQFGHITINTSYEMMEE